MLYPISTCMWLADYNNTMFHIYLTHTLYIPLTLRLLDILEVIAPYKHFHKLRQFVDLKLPDGFPVKLGEFLT